MWFIIDLFILPWHRWKVISLCSLDSMFWEWFIYAWHPLLWWQTFKSSTRLWLQTLKTCIYLWIVVFSSGFRKHEEEKHLRICKGKRSICTVCSFSHQLCIIWIWRTLLGSLAHLILSNEVQLILIVVKENFANFSSDRTSCDSCRSSVLPFVGNV
jgi:hypothetical protein